MQTISKTAKKYIDIIKSGAITERQIIDIRSWMGKDKDNASIVFDTMQDELTLDASQIQKGLVFLLNQWKTPTGQERKNNPFGYREQAILEDFRDLTLHGFYDASKYGQMSWYLPIYSCNSKSGNSFEYYYNGKVNIIG